MAQLMYDTAAAAIYQLRSQSESCCARNPKSRFHVKIAYIKKEASRDGLAP
jgi:hypothetical protein